MEKKNNKIFKYTLLTMLFLLAVRLIFFLRDGSSDLVETILFTMIFVLSVALLIYYLHEKIDNKKQFIKDHYDKFLFVVFIITLELLFKIAIQNGMSFVYIFTLLFGISLITVFSSLLPKKASRIFDITFASFFLIYVFVQDNYYELFSGLFSFKDLVNVGEAAEFTVGIYQFTIFHALYVITFIAFLVLYIKNKITTHILFSKKTVLSALKVPLFLLLLLNLNATYPVKTARLHTSDHYLYFSNFDSTKLASKFSLIDLLYRDVGGVITPSFTTKRDLAYVEDYFSTHEKTHVDNDYTNMFEGKNLIFILAESYDEIALSEELTPNIYKLKNEGLDFQNHYVPVYPRTTCDTEIILNTGLIPSINNGPTCYMFNSNSYSNSIAALFNNEGYVTTALHSNDSDFYTRDIVYIGLGYDSFLGKTELNMTDTDKRFDSLFATMAAGEIINENPFYSFVITLSGHSPYSDFNIAVQANYSAVDDYYGNSIPNLVKGFIATQIEADLFVENLIDELEATNQLDDTVIIFTNDHYPYTLDQDDYEEVSGKTNIHDKQKGFMYIWSTDIEHVEIDRLSSSFDIVPTLSNMFGLDANYSDYIGNDVFDVSQTQLVFFKDYYVYDGITFFSITNENLNIDEELYNQARKYYDLSIKILKLDYFNDAN